MNGNWTYYVFGLWKQKFRAWLEGMRRRRERRLKHKVAVALMRAQHLAQVFKEWKDHACDARCQRAATGRSDFLEAWRGIRLTVPFGFDSSRVAHSSLASSLSAVRSDSLIRVPDRCDDRASSGVGCGDHNGSLVSRSVQTDEEPLDEGERIKFAAHLQNLDAQLDVLIKLYEVKSRARPRRWHAKTSSESSSNGDEQQGSVCASTKLAQWHGATDVQSVTSSRALCEEVKVLEAEICRMQRKHEVLEKELSDAIEANKLRIEVVDSEMKKMQRKLDELSDVQRSGGHQDVGVGKKLGCNGGFVSGEGPLAVKAQGENCSGGGGPARQRSSQKGNWKQHRVLSSQIQGRKPQWK